MSIFSCLEVPEYHLLSHFREVIGVKSNNLQNYSTDLLIPLHLRHHQVLWQVCGSTASCQEIRHCSYLTLNESCYFHFVIYDNWLLNFGDRYLVRSLEFLTVIMYHYYWSNESHYHEMGFSDRIRKPFNSSLNFL